MDNYYSVNQTAIILKVHPLTIRRYIKQKNLKALRVGGAVRISKKDIDSFVKNFEPQVKTVEAVKKPLFKSFDSYDPIFRMKGRGASH